MGIYIYICIIIYIIHPICPDITPSTSTLSIHPFHMRTPSGCASRLVGRLQASTSVWCHGISTAKYMSSGWKKIPMCTISVTSPDITIKLWVFEQQKPWFWWCGWWHSMKFTWMDSASTNQFVDHDDPHQTHWTKMSRMFAVAVRPWAAQTGPQPWCKYFHTSMGLW